MGLGREGEGVWGWRGVRDTQEMSLQHLVDNPSSPTAYLLTKSPDLGPQAL